MATRSYSLPVGALVGQTIGIYLRNAVPFLVLSAIVLAPWIALRIALEDTMSRPENKALPLLLTLVKILLTNILTGAVTFGVVQQLRQKPAGIGSAISQGLSSFGRVLGTSLLCGIRIGVGLLLLVIPGIYESVRLFVAIPAAVMEGKSGGRAIERSATLVRGSGWALFGALLLAGLISAVLGMIGVFMLHASNEDFTSTPAWFDIGLAVVLGPFSATMAAVAYFMLRQGKENVDVKEIAAVFD
ncbi:MAG: glycerophosphoryl diester phosphodiesterase membrane domain-containing protein [Planctomycetota bacterium]